MNKTISLMIIGSISLLLAAVFIGQIASEGSKVTELTDNTQTLSLVTTRAYTWSGNITVVNETIATVDNATGENLAKAGYASVYCSILGVTNASSGTIIPATNYTQTNCNLKAKPGNPDFTDLDWNVTYKYDYKDNLGSINSSIYLYPTYYTDAATGWKGGSSGCKAADIASSIVVKNSSGATLTKDTDYTLDSNYGKIAYKNTRAVNNSVSNSSTFFITYCPDGYMDLGWGRTGIDTTMGLYALGALLVAVGMFFAAAKNAGIVGGNYD